ncbi:hypothetical protein GE107_02050 [Cohnella sp. CFH 77786]|uniref:coiled-coil domain-containing protein n=1 Tax=Cohnella sp. CFH 77786 TaxID=2662265 RepID=UPI001C60958C|nr:hypothetical protein [Cohnella sp. CFH 77786]MBW5444847.1 hypothetical protein [Cohnella sp. CFH 77786]
MRRFTWAGLLAIVLIFALSRAAPPLPVHAEPMAEETRKLLEKSLSVVEIDREIERISVLRQTTQIQIEESERQLARQEAAISSQREQAGRVLRAYYMGRKDFLLSALLNAGSLTELLRTWEWMELLIDSDRKVLDRYSQQYALLKEGHESLQQDKAELAAVEDNLRQQRERLLGLQDEIDKALAGRGDENQLRQMMAELEAYWKNVGLYEVRRNFRALAGAMQDLPDWLRDHPETMETKGLKTKLTIPDSGLNEFLRSRDPDFKQFTIRFEQDRMVLEGDNGDLQITIAGHYTIQEKPENAILFHVDALTFNGLALPDTTRADLEREFDLGFYPQKLIKFVKAQDVQIEPGRLIVELKIG